MTPERKKKLRVSYLEVSKSPLQLIAQPSNNMAMIVLGVDKKACCEGDKDSTRN